MSADYPDLPYVHARGDGGPRRSTQIIILHATDNTASAANEAAYATRREDETSAHYYVDDTQIIQALPVGNVAYGALGHGNAVGVQYELCGRSNQLSDATMRRAAAQVARDCARYGIPVRKLTSAQVRDGARGICGHLDVTYAWPEDGGDHTDPGANFPWSTFIGYVAAAAGKDTDMDLDHDKLAGTPDYPGRTAREALTDVWQRAQFDLPAVKAALARVEAKIATLATPQVDMTALVAALRPVIGAAVAEEISRRLES